MCFAHRNLHAELSERKSLHQSYHGSGVHRHRTEGQRVCVLCVLCWWPFQLILHNMCVSVSMCVCEVSWLKKQLSALSAPSNCKVWALVWQENRRFSPVCQTWYFNLDSSRVRVSGYCGNQAAVLSITMPDNAASLQFTFTKVRKKKKPQ